MEMIECKGGMAPNALAYLNPYPMHMQEVFEDHKIAIFKDMLEEFETIGIPVGGSAPYARARARTLANLGDKIGDQD